MPDADNSGIFVSYFVRSLRSNALPSFMYVIGSSSNDGADVCESAYVSSSL